MNGPSLVRGAVVGNFQGSAHDSLVDSSGFEQATASVLSGAVNRYSLSIESASLQSE